MTVDRRRQARALVSEADLDALVVSHPPNIRYLTGLQASAGAAILTAAGCVLIVDFRYATSARALADRAADLSVHVAPGAIDTAIGEVLEGIDCRRAGVEAEHLPLARFTRIAARMGGSSTVPSSVSCTLVATERVIERLRAVKDAGEIAVLREGARRLSTVARRAREWVRPGRSEQTVAALVDAAVREAGFERAAFDTIVASGPNAALPHARPTGRELRAGDGVVLDFGGIYDGYCVDLTRTLFLGAASPEARRVFEAVREAYQAAVGAVRPGAFPVDIDAAARRVLERHGLGEAFGHGTGHGLGLEVHEEPRISRHASGAEAVVPGMVFTIEPGAYVAGIGGVRIEDDVLVVDGGCEVLTDVPIDFGEA